MDVLGIAQLVLRIVLAIGFLALGLSPALWRTRKWLIEEVLPSTLAGSTEGATATRRMVGAANAVLAVSAIGGLALLAPWPAARLAGALALAALAVLLAAVQLAALRGHADEPAYRSELVPRAAAGLVLALLLVVSVL